MDREESAVSKRTALPPITIGFALLIAGSLVWLGGELREATTQIEDVRDRQSKYIGTNGSLTIDISDLEDELQALRERIIVLETT